MKLRSIKESEEQPWAIWSNRKEDEKDEDDVSKTHYMQLSDWFECFGKGRGEW